MAVTLRYFTEFGNFRGPLRKKWFISHQENSLPRNVKKVRQLSTTDVLYSSL